MAVPENFDIIIVKLTFPTTQLTAEPEPAGLPSVKRSYMLELPA